MTTAVAEDLPSKGATPARPTRRSPCLMEGGQGEGKYRAGARDTSVASRRGSLFRLTLRRTRHPDAAVVVCLRVWFAGATLPMGRLPREMSGTRGTQSSPGHRRLERSCNTNTPPLRLADKSFRRCRRTRQTTLLLPNADKSSNWLKALPPIRQWANFLSWVGFSPSPASVEGT